MAVMAWVIFYLLPYWSNSSHFANFSKSCIISDIGAECQVYCPTAGGTGTYSDPITLAVGHSIINGKDIGDYAYGTKFYVPNLRKYFTAADACGDGNTPQAGPCHTGFNGHVWLDLYVGGSLANGVLSCEDSIPTFTL
jgi:hypothetical protein